MIALAILVALAVALLHVTLPFFYAYLPGPVEDVALDRGLGGLETYSSEGGLFLTTVSVDINVTFVDW